MPFWQFFREAWEACALLVQTSKMHHSIWKILFVLGADEYLERLEGKIRKSLFFYVKIFKITVCLMTKKLSYIQSYISSHVKDIHDVLEITVYDEDKDHKYEFLGKGWLISESILISVADFQLHIYKPNDFSTTFKI